MMGSSALMRSLAWLGSGLAAFGLARLGSVSSLLATDTALFGFPTSLRSLARLGFLTLAIDSSLAGSSLAVRTHCQVEALAAVLGSNCLGPVSMLPVTDGTLLGSSLLLRSAS